MDSVHIGTQAMITFHAAMTAKSWGQTLSND